MESYSTLANTCHLCGWNRQHKEGVFDRTNIKTRFILQDQKKYYFEKTTKNIYIFSIEYALFSHIILISKPARIGSSTPPARARARARTGLSGGYQKTNE